jgi:hypothetical protein
MSGGPAGGFGAGQCLDLAPGSARLHSFIETDVDSGRLGEASEDEIIGLITAADRAGAAVCYLKHAVATELIRRRPAPGCTLAGPSRMPDHYLDSVGDEVKWALAETRPVADGILSLAWDLQVKLPGTSTASRAGLPRHHEHHEDDGRAAGLHDSVGRADEARRRRDNQRRQADRRQPAARPRARGPSAARSRHLESGRRFAHHLPDTEQVIIVAERVTS